MSTPVVVLLVVVIAGALFALAWWSSGRVRGRAPSYAASTAAKDDALRHYRPNGSTPPNIGGGGGSS